MKRIYLFLSILFSVLSINAQNINKGYKGFIEGGYSLNTGGTCAVNWVELNTIHGYQATSSIFIGAGVGFHFMPELRAGNISGRPMWKRDSKMEIPIFADFKWTFLQKKITPFLDLRLGHNVSNGSGMYGSAGIGCRFAIKQHALNVIAAYSIHKINVERLDGVSTWRYKEIEEGENAISIKIGYEF